MNATAEDIKEGYKLTKVGLIPDDWKVIKLGDIGNIVSGLTYSPDDVREDGMLVLRSSNIYDRLLKFDDNVFVEASDLKFNPVQEGDILICVRNGSKSLIGKNTIIPKSAEGLAFGAFMSVFRSEYNNYLFQLFDTDLYNRQIHDNLGATINSINGSDLKNFIFPLPSLPERQKIAEILSTWDQAIQKCEQTVKELKNRNKGLAQQLLTCKKRLKGFETKWKTVTLAHHVTYCPRPVDKPATSFLALGLRSHGKGIFHKEDFDPETIAMDILYEVKENDLVVNITFAWEHAIAIAGKADDGGLVSHRFPTYTFNEETSDATFFKFFILQPYFKFLLELISPGGAGRNRVMSKKDFLKLEIKTPEKEEQTTIAKVLEEADQELKLSERKLLSLREQKKGLMQKLLTGEIRVNVK